jgi:hypothetical protein
MPDTMVNWFVEAGYTDVRSDTNLASRPSLSNAEAASNLLIMGYKVVLLVGANMLDTSTQDDHSRIPDHWVALTSPIAFQPGREALPPQPEILRADAVQGRPEGVAVVPCLHLGQGPAGARLWRPVDAVISG